MSLEIVICDDEKTLRKNLKKIITTELDLCGFTYRITEFESGETLLLHLKDCTAKGKQTEPQIVFLDIEMKELNGIETAKALRGLGSRAQIIFVTSYRDFVFQGYEVRALNYILKPYEAEKIAEVLHTALKVLDITAEKYFLVEKKDLRISLPLSSIKYFSSDRRQVRAVTTQGDYHFYDKLNDLPRRLNTSFVRIHNRYLVNLNFVQKITGSTAVVAGEELPVSRSCRAELEMAFARYMLR